MARDLVDNLIGKLDHSLFPPACILCDDPVENTELCTACADDLAINDPACRHCAIPMSGNLDDICGQCLEKMPLFDSALAPFHYSYPIDKLIQQFKFGGNLRIGRALAEMWSPLILKQAIKLPEVVIPVPLHKKRLATRGFNQSLELARDIGKYLRVPVMRKCLLRTRATRAQSELDADSRSANVRGAFTVRSRSGLPNHIALIDDVMTTGHTLNQCALELKRAGVERVDAWVIARA